MRKIDKSKYKEYMEYAEKCTANRVYPVSIANGIQDGEIYTDDKGCVLFRHYCGFAYLSGNVNPEVLEEVYQEFLVDDMNRRFLLITDSKDITDFYFGRELIQLDRRIEYVHSGILENMPALDERFAYERITVENIGDIQGRIIPSFSWRSSDAFLRNGFGFLIRDREDGCFAAVAFSSAISQEEVDIGVETAASYRHNGLASDLACRMCEEIVNQGKRPVWAHAEANTGSQETAIRAGFKPCKINTVIRKIR